MYKPVKLSTAYCQKSGKVKMTKNASELAIKANKKSIAYQCEFCGKWHLTKQVNVV